MSLYRPGDLEMKKATSVLLLAGLAVAACLQAQAAEPQAAASADNAQMTGIDAKTGKLRPLTASEANALAVRAAAMRRGSASWAKAPRTPAEARATLRRHGSHSASMRVPTSAMSSMVVTRGANGAINISETDNEAMPAAPQQEVTK
jgi:hypothetical protein